MQEIKKEKNSYYKRKKLKKISILIIMILILISTCIITVTMQVIRQKQIKQLEGKQILEYEIKNKIDDKSWEILIKINSIEGKGIEKIKYISPKTNKEIELNARGKLTIGIDFIAEDMHDYVFNIKEKDEPEKEEILHFEIPRIKGNYTLDNGIYVNEPDTTGYIDKFTRYLNVKLVNNEKRLEVGNWIGEEKPENWYNYKEQEWANIYVETSGIETYYVWIPRYCFKLNQETQRSEVKFIDVYNNYKDENGNITEWYGEGGLKEQGYQVPEAFEFNNTQIPGYWAMKYTVGDIITPSTINYDMAMYKGTMTIKNIRLNTTITNTNPITKYTIALNGKIIETITDNAEINNIGEKVKTIGKENLKEENNVINITGLNENGDVVGSMTKEYKPAVVNEPDLTGFNPETTFYVTYDDNEKEHSTIPITKEKPKDWYEYGESRWANIVTRNNGLETYYVWIPRYEFTLDQVNQRSNVKFIQGTGGAETEGHQVPEAFTFNGQELTGYWAMKYTVGTETAPTFDTEVVATNTSIKTKGITGTLKADGQKYNYYINGEYKGTNEGGVFEYTDLQPKTKYTVLVEIRNAVDEHIGAIVKQISTIDANKPELGAYNEETKEYLTSFNEEKTYYVLYDNDGNETIGEKIKRDGSNMPENWYNYSESKWANIVVTNGQVVDGKITNATMTTYYVWIPRYQFMITSSQQAQPLQGRTEVRFIEGTSTETDINYQIPEAFTFNGKQLTGYWAMKYTAGE